MRFITGLSRRHRGRRSAPSKKGPGAGNPRFRRGTSASLLFRRRAAISMILAALMLVGNIPATAAGTVTSTIPVGSLPAGVAFTPDGSTAYVINTGSDTVSVIDVASGTVTSTIPVGPGPNGVAFTPDGSTAYVTNTASDTVSVITVASGTVTSTITVGSEPVGIAFTPDGSTAYVTDNGFRTVSVIDVASGTVTSTITVGSHPYGVAFTPDGSTAYVTNDGSDSVSVISVVSGTVTSTIPAGSNPTGVAFTPDGSTAYVTNYGSHTVSVINVVSAPPVFTADTPPTKATTRAAYSYTFTATGDPAPTFYVSSGALPAGLSLDSSTGVLSGTPTKAGKATFKVTATNGVSPDAVTQPITITVTKGKGR